MLKIKSIIMKIRINKIIINISYIYCIIPILCFTCFYMQSLIGYCATAIVVALIICSLWNRKKEQNTEESLTISWRLLVVLFLIALLWAAFGGQGNHYYQSHDWNWRNAIFRDLIYQDWPVIYEKYNKALVYYIGFWLPAASVVKIIAKIFPAILTTSAAFTLGNQLLWIWTTIGVFLVELLLITYIKPKTVKKMLCVPVLLIGFSGLDILGVLYKIIVEDRKFANLHLEWWMDGKMQFSSLTTCLFWVFNQCVIPWIVILCVLQEKTIRNYVLLGICALISGPLPFLGVFVYMVCNAVVLLVKAIKEKTTKEYIRNLTSIQNLLSLLIIPVIFLYYKSNGAVETGAEDAGMSILGIVNTVPITGKYLIQVFFFLLCEVGVYFVILFKRYKREPFFYMTIGTACIAPFFAVGTGKDFIMRFSIPTIMVLAALCGKYLLGENEWKKDICQIALCVALAIGAFTPMTEFMRGYNSMLVHGHVINVDDELKTFDQELYPNDINFTTYDYEKQIFFKYLIK